MLSIDTLVDRLQAIELSATQTIVGLVVVAWAVRAVGHATYQLLTKDHVVGHLPPFPKSTLPIVANTFDLMKNVPRLYDWLTELCLEFRGQPFRIEAYGLAQTVMLTNPDHIEQVLKSDFENFEKGQFVNEVLYDLAGNGIFASDGDTWYHQRKTASHLFTMRTLRDTMTHLAHKHLKNLVQIFEVSHRNDHAFDLAAQLHAFTLHAFTDMAFGVDLSVSNDPKLRAFPAAFDFSIRHMSYRMNVPRPLWKFQRYWNLAAEATLKENIKIVHSTTLDIIAQSLAQQRARTTGNKAETQPNLVSLFLDSFDRDDKNHNAVFDPTYLRDIVVNIMVAGRDTTAQAMSWFFYCLSEHPHVANKIRDEIAQLAPELLTPGASFASMEQVAKLHYLEAAIKETLRLYPSVPLNIRTTVRDTILADGTLLKKGMMVGLPTYALGRMPHVWGPNAATYDPERWFDPSTGKPLVVSAFKFNSFHAGPRQCIGQQLAMLEMKIVAAALLTRFELTVEPGQTITYGRSLTLPMKHPFMVKVTRRNA